MKPETKTVETLPEAERQRLQEAFAIAQETGIKTVDFAAQRLKAVLSIGQTLNHWRRKVARYEWSDWLNVNVFTIVEITPRSLTNWMRLADAQSQGKLKIEAGIGVRSALIQAGICPANDKASTIADSKIKGVPAIIQAIIRVSHQAARLDVDKLDDNQKRTLASALRTMALLHGRIAVALNS